MDVYNYVSQKKLFLSSQLAVKRAIAVIILLKMYVCVCMNPPGFVRAITPTFMDGFQNYFTQLLSLRRRSAIEIFFYVSCRSRSHLKVT